jgi:hypothetical protein
MLPAASGVVGVVSSMGAKETDNKKNFLFAEREGHATIVKL